MWLGQVLLRFPAEGNFQGCSCASIVCGQCDSGKKRPARKGRHFRQEYAEHAANDSSMPFLPSGAQWEAPSLKASGVLHPPMWARGPEGEHDISGEMKYSPGKPVPHLLGSRVDLDPGDWARNPADKYGLDARGYPEGSRPIAHSPELEEHADGHAVLRENYGDPRAELFAKHVMQRAGEMKVTPTQALDMILSGTSYSAGGTPAEAEKTDPNTPVTGTAGEHGYAEGGKTFEELRRSTPTIFGPEERNGYVPTASSRR
jgi:hypothetical protein